MTRLLRVAGAIGAITRLFSFTFLIPAFIALVYDPYLPVAGRFMMPLGFPVFMFCFGAGWLLGSALKWLGSSAGMSDLRDRDAYLTVGAGWLFLCALAMLPFLMSGTLRSPVDAFFEAMSGMTTMGASVITDLEAVAPSVMIWRGLLQFIGGMGIVVLSVALLAKLTQGGVQLLQAESPGPSITRIAPRLAHTARILWGVYLGVAVVCFLALLTVLFLRHDFTAKQTVFEALMHTFTTVATGGFSNHSQSIAFFDDWVLELVIIIIVLISGTNYTLHYYWLTGHGRRLLRDAEWRFYIGTFVAVVGTITFVLWRAGEDPVQALRDAAFTTASLITSTGFATADFDAWPATVKLLLFLVMVTGATAGSTSGGLKHVRVLLLFKLMAHEVQRILHPRSKMPVRLGGRAIARKTMMTVAGFLLAYVGIWAACAIALMIIDPIFARPIDAASASISALSNMGPAFGVVGPSNNYAGLNVASKILLSLEMWVGRLEIFAAILVFTPRAWRH